MAGFSVNFVGWFCKGRFDVLTIHHAVYDCSYFKKMRYYQILLLTFLITGAILLSCDHKPRSGSDLSTDEIEYIYKLGLLEENENIILFDGQSDFRTSGNFVSDKRIAAYWIDKRDKTKSSVNFGFYSEIDTILTKDMSRTLTYASYLKVVMRDGRSFKVYTDGDSAEVWTFFDRATSEWRGKNYR